MNVVIYSRVSSQSARQSTERQVVDLERFAAGRGYEVTAVFEENIRVYSKPEPGNITAGQDGKPLVLSDYYPIGGTGRNRTPGDH